MNLSPWKSARRRMVILGRYIPSTNLALYLWRSQANETLILEHSLNARTCTPVSIEVAQIPTLSLRAPYPPHARITFNTRTVTHLLLRFCVASHSPRWWYRWYISYLIGCAFAKTLYVCIHRCFCARSQLSHDSGSADCLSVHVDLTSCLAHSQFLGHQRCWFAQVCRCSGVVNLVYVSKFGWLHSGALLLWNLNAIPSPYFFLHKLTYDIR